MEGPHAELGIERTLDKTKDEETPKVSGGVYGIRCRVRVEPFFSMGVAPNKYITCYETGPSRTAGAE